MCKDERRTKNVILSEANSHAHRAKPSVMAAPEPPSGRLNGSRDFRFVLDTDSLLVAPEKAKILLLVSPHNPTGHCISREEWNEAVRFCEDNNMILVVDEVFGDYAFSDKVSRSWQYVLDERLETRENRKSKDVRRVGCKTRVVASVILEAERRGSIKILVAITLCRILSGMRAVETTSISWKTARSALFSG